MTTTNKDQAFLNLLDQVKLVIYGEADVPSLVRYVGDVELLLEGGVAVKAELPVEKKEKPALPAEGVTAEWLEQATEEELLHLPPRTFILTTKVRGLYEAFLSREEKLHLPWEDLASKQGYFVANLPETTSPHYRFYEIQIRNARKLAYAKGQQLNLDFPSFARAFSARVFDRTSHSAEARLASTVVSRSYQYVTFTSWVAGRIHRQLWEQNASIEERVKKQVEEFSADQVFRVVAEDILLKKALAGEEMAARADHTSFSDYEPTTTWLSTISPSESSQ